MPWKEEGEVPWSDGVGGTETGVAHNNIVGGASGRMKRALLKTTGRKFKLHENEKDLNEIILSRKRENHTETLGGGMWRI